MNLENCPLEVLSAVDSANKSNLLGQFLRKIREENKFGSLKEFGAKVGVSNNTLGSYERGESLPDIDFLLTFADVTGHDFMHLLVLRVQESSSSGADVVKAILVSIAYVLEGLQDKQILEKVSKMWKEGEGREAAPKGAAPIEGFVLVPHYDLRSNVDHDAGLHSEQIVDHLAFRTEWVKNALGVAHKDLALVTAKGDSMEPTISNGDMILIDMSVNRIEDSSIYILQYNGSLLVRRIQKKLDGTVIIKVDNLKYDPEVLDGSRVEALRVLGRVVWSGHRMYFSAERI